MSVDGALDLTHVPRRGALAKRETRASAKEIKKQRSRAYPDPMIGIRSHGEVSCVRPRFNSGLAQRFGQIRTMSGRVTVCTGTVPGAR